MDDLKSAFRTETLGRCATLSIQLLLVGIFAAALSVATARAVTVATGTASVDFVTGFPTSTGTGTLDFCLAVPECANQSTPGCCGTASVSATVSPNFPSVPAIHLTTPNGSCCKTADPCVPGLPNSEYWGWCECPAPDFICHYATCDVPGCFCHTFDSCFSASPTGGYSETVSGGIASFSATGAYNQTTGFFGGPITSGTFSPSALAYLQAHGVNPAQLSCTTGGIAGQSTVDANGIQHYPNISVTIDCVVNPQPAAPTSVPTMAGQPTPTAMPTPTPLPAGANNTQAGSNVQLSTSNTFTSPQTGETVTIGGSIQFSGVTSPGLTTATLSSGSGGDVPPNFAVGVNGLPGVYMDVSTTAVITPPITVCLAYPDANNDGFVDGTNPPLPETLVRILHRENGTFVDRTDPSKTSYASNIVCATTTSLSPFVQGAEINVPGGGSPKQACFTEFQLRRNSVSLGDSVAAAPYIPFKKGVPDSAKISCRDGDPCDADSVAGQCTFTVLVCPNETDSRLSSCTPSTIAKYVLKKPLPTAKDATDAATASAALTALEALGPNTVTGATVTYSPSLAGTDCSAPISVVVPLKNGKKANRLIKLDAYTATGVKDTNSLKLTCNP